MASSLELSGVTVRARGKALIEDVSLKLDEGGFVALLGPNGAGKTTLLRAALGLASIEGACLLNGKPVGAYSGRERAGIIAWLPQQALVSEPITALELVAAARYRFNETHPASVSAAREALAHTGASEFADRTVTSLSGGEHQRVAIAALIAQDAPLLLLDEPANHLDPAQQIELYRLFGKLWREGRGILCITHDVNLLRHVGEAGGAQIRVAGMADGQMRFEAPFTSDDLPAQVGALFDVEMRRVEGLLIPEVRP